MNKEQEEIARELVTLVNEFLTNITKKLQPKNFPGDHELFVKMAMAPACMVAGTIIDKIATTFEIPIDEMVKDFVANVYEAISQSRLMHQLKAN